LRFTGRVFDEDAVAWASWWGVLDNRWEAGMSAGDGLSADVGKWGARGEVLFSHFGTCLSSGKSAAQHVIGPQTL
jgi:hypothetical protein